ncbi:MAG: acyl carrier protein [Planctomycetota bacterium]
MPPLDQLLTAIFGVGDLADDATMADVPSWDSLTHMDLIARLESTYSIELTGDEIADMQSVGAIRAILARHGVH